MRTTVLPLGDRILAKRAEAETVTEHGIIIPEVGRERPQEAIVVAVGPGKPSPYTGQIFRPNIVVGDRILIGKYVGSEVSINNELFLILREEEVLGVIRDDEEAA